MYAFRDITAKTSAADDLPSEALKINGEYIENLITGYRTLSVSGRESLSAEINTFETGVRDGSRIKNRRYPMRVITVRYQLKATSSSDFRNKYNKLAEILNVDDAELIFRDESDKFFIGTPAEVGEVEPGSNVVTGEFSIICADPFKYSINEKEVSPTSESGFNVFTIDYKGTYKAFPTLEAQFYEENETDGSSETALTGNGDCGFIAFYNEREKIIQIGGPDETDGETLPKSQTLVSQSFKKSTSWGTAAKNKWAVNGGVASSGSYAQTGTIKVDKSFSNAATSQYYLTANSYGSGSAWHGATVTRTIPADKSGETGATNFTVSYKQKMSIGTEKNANTQCGAFQMLIASGSGSSRKIVAGVCIEKRNTGTKGKLKFYLNGGTVHEMDIDLSLNNKMFGNNSAAKNIKTVKDSFVIKTGATVSFNVGGVKKSFRDESIADAVVTQVTFGFYQRGTKTPLGFNGLYSAKFVKHNCDTWRDVPNKFGSGDYLVADCKNGKIYLNGTETPEYGALGNDWEEFFLSPGTNQIGVSYSDFVSSAYAPTFSIRYREVFL